MTSKHQHLDNPETRSSKRIKTQALTPAKKNAKWRKLNSIGNIETTLRASPLLDCEGSSSLSGVLDCVGFKTVLCEGRLWYRIVYVCGFFEMWTVGLSRVLRLGTLRMVGYALFCWEGELVFLQFVVCARAGIFQVPTLCTPVQWWFE